MYLFILFVHALSRLPHIDTWNVLLVIKQLQIKTKLRYGNKNSWPGKHDRDVRKRNELIVLNTLTQPEQIRN